MKKNKLERALKTEEEKEKMIDYTIREMTIKDYDAVLALWNNTEGLKLDESDEFENMKYYLDRNPGLSFVAVMDDTIIGTIKCGQDGRRGYIYHLAIEKRYMGKGISKKLYQKSITGLKKQKIYKCNLYVLSTNKDGLEYWEHNGWKILDPDLKMLQRDLREKNEIITKSAQEKYVA